VVSFTPRQLYSQGKNPRYPLDRGLQIRYGHGVEDKNFHLPPGIEPRSSKLTVRSQSLYRLRYPGLSLTSHNLMEYHMLAINQLASACLSYFYRKLLSRYEFLFLKLKHFFEIICEVKVKVKWPLCLSTTT
jgi:hypothetical protein